eukprot:226467_1
MYSYQFNGVMLMFIPFVTYGMELFHEYNKMGLFDVDSLMTSELEDTPRFRADVKDSVGSGCDFLERDRFFLKSRTGSEDKLSVDTDLCKKEVHDAYERGFLAVYFSERVYM